MISHISVGRVVDQAKLEAGGEVQIIATGIIL
jgi:hypothetical protein